MKKTGFIGLGIMGRPMAKNLLQANCDLYVYDLNKAVVDEFVELGAKSATLKEIGETCDVIFTILPNGKIVQDVLFGKDGICETVKEGTIVCDMSSVTPTESKTCYAKLKEMNVGFIDSPVSGGEPKAIDGTLAFMAGGEQQYFDGLKEYFDVMGSSALLIGESGSGSVTKLANQIIVNLTIATVSEALVLAKKAGADPEKVYKAIRGGLAGSTVLDAKAPMMIDYIPKIKQQMDLWMKVEMPDGGEREYKHIVAKENNYGLIGKESDYFIGDIEYRGCLNNYLFDMIGVKWAVDNDNSENLDLALFKMYYGDKHLKTLEEVLSDLNNMIEFLYDEKSLSLLKDDLKEIYKAKTILGLLYPYEELKIGFSDKIEIVYIFGNQSNENNNLKNILIGIKNSKQYEEISKIADIKIAKSSFMGYGLYEKNMMNLDYAINML